jgi:hypothetical protein
MDRSAAHLEIESSKRAEKNRAKLALPPIEIERMANGE